MDYSEENQNWDSLSYVEKNHQLYLDTALLTDTPPINLNAKLYPYQETGYRWLKYVTDESCGCILGDEMGLGKTLQVMSPR